MGLVNLLIVFRFSVVGLHMLASLRFRSPLHAALLDADLFDWR